MPTNRIILAALEGVGLGLFMLSAACFAVLLEHPASPVRMAVDGALLRRLLMGLAMAGTALFLIYGPIGRRSGGHFNPATTLTFWRLGKVRGADACAYIAGQFAGAVAGVTLAALAIGEPLESVMFVATRPGPLGSGAAFAAEALMAGALILVVLTIANRPAWNRFAGCAAAAMVALYITFEAPISGMSLNPARSFAPELHAGLWRHLWIYFLAPPLGMLAAAEVHLLLGGPVLCARTWHAPGTPCPFICTWPGCRGAAPDAGRNPIGDRPWTPTT